MSISVNGQSKVPPGFRFHPTEEELLQYYLRKKVSYKEIDLDVIKDVDLNRLEPWDIQEMCKIGSTPQNDWYFFSHKDKKYPTSTRTNRATAAGFWKATGRDKVIHTNGKRIGMRKTLVFYKGRAPNGHKSDWIMHEYRLLVDITNVHCAMGEMLQEEGWVVCRIFKKKNHYKKTFDNSPNISASSSMITCDAVTTERLMIDSTYNDEGTLEQILHQPMGRPCKEEGDESKDDELADQFFNTNNINFINDDDADGFVNDPMMALDDHDNDLQVIHQILPSLSSSSSSSSSNLVHKTQDYCNNEIDLWSFPESFLSSKDPLCLNHVEY
ncbi:hypothetical protein LguiA_010534 [Lonicera macranthoides]